MLFTKECQKKKIQKKIRQKLHWFSCQNSKCNHSILIRIISDYFMKARMRAIQLSFSGRFSSEVQKSSQDTSTSVRPDRQNRKALLTFKIAEQLQYTIYQVISAIGKYIHCAILFYMISGLSK